MKKQTITLPYFKKTEQKASRFKFSETITGPIEGVISSML